MLFALTLAHAAAAPAAAPVVVVTAAPADAVAFAGCGAAAALLDGSTRRCFNLETRASLAVAGGFDGASYVQARAIPLWCCLMRQHPHATAMIIALACMSCVKLGLQKEAFAATGRPTLHCGVLVCRPRRSAPGWRPTFGRHSARWTSSSLPQHPPLPRASNVLPSTVASPVRHVALQRLLCCGLGFCTAGGPWKHKLLCSHLVSAASPTKVSVMLLEGPCPLLFLCRPGCHNLADALHAGPKLPRPTRHLRSARRLPAPCSSTAGSRACAF